MIQSLRKDFNHRFHSSVYARLMSNLERRCGMAVPFRIAETPCFVPRELMATMETAGVELARQLVEPAYLRHSEQALAEPYRVPGESRTPLFLVVDFGLVREQDGGLAPRLVELQGCSSIQGFAAVLGEEYQACYGLDPSLSYLRGGHTWESYWQALREALLAGHAPEHVVLADLHPGTQKTLPDFHLLRAQLGLPIVDITRLVREGRRLFYRDGAGRLVRIHRLYNRTILDELEREHLHLPFDLREELEVEWAGHPNWFFRASKFSLPFLRHPTVPRAVFLHELAHQRHLLPERREDWVLKPLYSFAGQGIRFGPTEEELAAIPAAQRHLYLLEERVHFEPTVDTPEGPTQAEFRLCYLWPEQEAAPRPQVTIVRMGRGLMMGVRSNHDHRWAGVSAAFTA